IRARKVVVGFSRQPVYYGRDGLRAVPFFPSYSKLKISRTARRPSLPGQRLFSAGGSEICSYHGLRTARPDGKFPAQVAELQPIVSRQPVLQIQGYWRCK